MTTLAAALTAAWPSSPLTVPVMVEADASGGDVKTWHRLSAEPGLASLAAASRRPNPDVADGVNPLLEYATETPPGFYAVTAEAAAHHCEGAVWQLGQRPWLLKKAGAAVADLGRITPRGPGLGILGASGAAVIAVEEEPAHLARLAACSVLTNGLEEAGVRAGLALTGGRDRFTDAEICAQTGLPVWARIPHDTLGAGFLRGQELPAGRTVWARARSWARERRDVGPVDWMPLLRCARDLAERLDTARPRTPGEDGPAQQGRDRAVKLEAVA
ncbi:hypothetical protein [Nocardiopsis chromatogenes]|uniref:hypothetical protein n=1 Tax=Nocardiopsis chromatogenes TaxID=280239 RepID=UPI0012686050|nr:hypothetical protein [Nocardiopsis chromatogenes]